jgi:large subunit ribosomal protein L31
MKKDIHPDYKEVVFQDVQSDFKFLTRSTLTSKEKIKWEDGKEYPLIKIEVSSASHPFYTGKKIFVDTAGRVEKFYQKYKAKAAIKSASKGKSSKVETPKVETPKVETPKVETPKVETPKVETPKVETPKVETPKVELRKEKTSADETDDSASNDKTQKDSEESSEKK